jgi:hypothetical protein
VVLAVVATGWSLSTYGQEPAGKTINDKVFSLAQAARGKKAYRAHCANGCHLVEMTGLERTPALASDAFMLRWNGQTLADLYLRMQMTMPQTAPRSLPDQMYADILAYVLSANGLPAGDAELAPDPAVLKTIKFVPPPQ